MSYKVSLCLQDDGSILIRGGCVTTPDGDRFNLRLVIQKDEDKPDMPYSKLLYITNKYGGGVLDEQGIHPPQQSHA